MPSTTPSKSIIADTQMLAGANFEVASFRLWYPKGVEKVKAVLLLMPGSNSDGREEVTNKDWQQFATNEGVALVGAFMRDADTSRADELYAQAGLGSGQALLEALGKLATQTGRCELSAAPLLLWGFSAGGGFNFDFTCFAPERVIAFVVNKGGYYHPPTPTPAAASVPALMFVGGKDEPFRNDAINTMYAAGRAAGAPWALAVEKRLAHEIGDSRVLALPFFHAILPLRLPVDGGAELRKMDKLSNPTGDLNTLSLKKPDDPSLPKLERTAWFPDQDTANLWKTVVNK